VKKLRRKNIRSYEDANEYLKSEYLPEHNRRFAHTAASPEDYHHQRPNQAVLDEAFRLETEGVIGNDCLEGHSKPANGAEGVRDVEVDVKRGGPPNNLRSGH
jgi:hypothetical protein